MKFTITMLRNIKHRDKFITKGLEEFDDVEDAGVLLVASVETGFGQNVIDFTVCERRGSPPQNI